MKYKYDPELQEIAEEISRLLFPHIKIGFFKCIRSYGTSTRNTTARCHALGKVMQMAIGVKAYYALEFLSERFDRLPADEQTKVIIHELMHIPYTFGGGFKHHDHVTNKNVELHYQTYLAKKEQVKKNENWFKV